jgi:outer membrane protein insertion porin family
LNFLTDLNDQPMQRYFFRFCVVIIAAFSVQSLSAQETDTTKSTSVDPRLLEWDNAKAPKEYIISHIAISGIKYLDTAIVLSISGLQVGDKITHTRRK